MKPLIRVKRFQDKHFKRTKTLFYILRAFFTGSSIMYNVKIGKDGSFGLDGPHSYISHLPSAALIVPDIEGRFSTGLN